MFDIYLSILYIEVFYRGMYYRIPICVLDLMINLDQVVNFLCWVFKFIKFVLVFRFIGVEM